MSTVVVRYTPKADRADENQSLVEAAFAELHEIDPGGVRYATFRLADGTFVHVADIEADPNPLADIAAFATSRRASWNVASRATDPTRSRRRWWARIGSSAARPTREAAGLRDVPHIVDRRRVRDLPSAGDPPCSRR